MAIRRLRMILPEFDPTSGEVLRRLFLRDDRVPRPFSFDRPPRLLGSYDGSELCPDGRHLWDAIVATGECQLDDDEREHLPFRLTLTCVRCGLVECLAGITDEQQSCDGGRLPPEPLMAGELRAQQVRIDRLLGFPTWHVFDASGARIGSMTTGCTVRGRRYVAGRLDDGGMPGVEAPTAAACLRKLARIHALEKAAGDAG